MPRPRSLAQLVAAATQQAPREAAVECHLEVLARLGPQIRLTQALAASSDGARTLRMLVAGVSSQMEAISPLLESSLDQYHRELASIEARYAMMISTVVDFLRDLDDDHNNDDDSSDGDSLAALEGLIESHVGAALLLRHQLQAHAGHLENLPEATKRRRPPSLLGVVDVDFKLKDAVLHCARDAAMLAFADDDIVELKGFDDHAVVAVPHHTSHALLELLKNAVHSQVAAGTQCEDEAVVVEWTGQSLVVRDRGVGLDGGRGAFADLARLTPGRRYDRVEEQTSYAMVPHPLGGIKVGLFVATVHANHFRRRHDDAENYLVVDSPGAGFGAVADLRLPNDLDATERLPDLEPLIARLSSP